jgi:hypothetical protein
LDIVPPEQCSTLANNLSNRSRNQAQQMGSRLITKRQETASDCLNQGHGNERCQTNPIKYEQAEKVLRQTLSVMEPVLHPDILISITYLVMVLRSQGKCEQAVEGIKDDQHWR